MDKDLNDNSHMFIENNEEDNSEVDNKDNSHMFDDDEKENIIKPSNDNSYMFVLEDDKEVEKTNTKKNFSNLKVKITSISLAFCLGFATKSSITLIKNNSHKTVSAKSNDDLYKEKNGLDTYPSIGSYYNDKKSTKVFYPGEHIVSVPIAINNDVRKHVYRFSSHKGYEPVKIFIAAAGDDNSFAGGYIIYQNTETVKCTSNKVSSEHDSAGDYIYDKFGSPVYSDEDDKYNIKKGEFDVGEHIISVPIGMDQFDIDNFNKNKEHEGYTLIDVCGTLYGDNSSFGGACALYKNNVPIITNKVNSKYSSYDNYEEFGYPIEKDKTKVLK